ncbi:MAG: toprim domain-containing protein [Desulfobulbus sp.]|nr:toprim domain-containing protein [Desulfobulbus sp.]
MSRFENNSSLGGKVLECLKNSEWWTDTTRISGSTIQGLTCPACGEKAAGWAYLNSPMAINCNRLSQCGARTKTLELFQELKRNFDTDFKPTKAEPHRPAREYLLSRGIPEALLQGLNFWYLANVRNTGGGAVMFTVGKDVQGRQQANGRLFNSLPGDGKSHNIGSHSGLYWRHPGFSYDPTQPVWITEGIIDALSLLAMDQQAIAVLAAGQDPAKIDLSEFPQKVVSFDNDEAGRSACRKWFKVYQGLEAILCDTGHDWNDLLTGSATPGQAKKKLEEALPRFKNNGKLALAESAAQWADIYHQFHQHPPELFDFNRETYFAQLKSPRGSDLPPYLETRRILRASIKVISYVIDTANPTRPEFRYNLEVTPSQKGRRPLEATASGRDLSTARTLNEFFLSFAKVNFEGDHRAASAIQAKITTAKAPEVQQLTVIGYQTENAAYVFPRWGVDTGGQLLHPDKRGHFRIGHNRFFRPPAHGETKAITPESITPKQVQDVFHGIREAWGLNGVAAFSWALAGWFVNQIKEEESFFPFISLWGDPAAGKSALVVLLNNIQGREGEGLPISQLNSKKGMVRTIGQVSGMFTPLLEDNERNEKGFDYSMLLTGFNRGPLQVQAAFSADLQTKESPFLGALMFVQNVEPFSSKAERQRVISLQFKAEDLTDTSRAAYEKLMGTGKKVLAGVMQQVLLNRSHFESAWQREYSTARSDLAPMIERRVLDNHALILSFYRLFCSCFNIRTDQAFIAFMKEIGKRKCISAATRQTTIADHFFELLDTIDEEKAATAYHIDTEKGWLLVNLPKVENILRNKGLNFQASEPLNTALQRHPSFIRNGLGYRFPNDPDTDQSGRTKRRRVWVFDIEWHKNSHLAIEEGE